MSAAADDEYAYSLSNTASSSATSLSVVESAKKTICQATTQKELQESNRRIAELSRAYEQFQSVNDTCKNKFLKKNLPEKSREYELAKSGLGQLANLENQAYNKPMMLSNSNRQKRESMELKRDAFDGVKATLDSMPSYQDFLGVCLSRIKDFADPAFVDFRNYLLKNHRQGQDIEQELLLDLQKSQGARKKKRLSLMTTRQNVLEEYLKGDLAMRPLFKRYLELRRCEQETIR